MIGSTVHYLAWCDRCKQERNHGYVGWFDTSELNAEYAAFDEDWHIEGGNHLCPDCLPTEPERDDL